MSAARPPRVAIVAPYPRTADAHGEESLGGVASYTKNLVDELRRHARVRVVAPGEGAPGARRDGDVEVHDIRREGASVPRALRSLGRDAALDAVHVQFEQHLFGGMLQNLRLAFALMALKRRKRVVITLHQVPDLREVDRAFLQRNGFPPLPILARLWMRLQYALLAAASHVLLVHEPRLRDRLAGQYRIGRALVAVVPHGVELHALPCSQADAKARLGASGKVLLLYFGYVTGYKGVDLLADALERVPAQERARLRVVIAGKVPERKLESGSFRAESEKLEARIAALGPWVERKGFLTPAQISLHLAGADAVLFPYRQVFGASGPFAITLGHGRPFLVSDAFEGMGVPHAALFPRDPDALAATIRRALQDPRLLESLATEARRMASEASWARVAERTALAYRDGASASARPPAAQGAEA